MSEWISVIVPIYNVEKYLDKCIQSIVSQSYENLQIILVDDGATDRSGEISDQWARKDDRIQVIHQENGGLSDARNAGLSVASGKWVSFIDSDDFISADTLERMYTAATENSCDIAVCNMVRIYDDGSTEPFYQPVTDLQILSGDSRYETLCQPSVCNKLFRINLLEGVRFPKGKYYEDTFVYHILAHRAQAIALTGHDGYFYLSRRDSILGQPVYTDRYFDCVEAIYTRVDYFLKEKESGPLCYSCLSLYAVTSNAEKSITPTSENKERFQKMRQWYHVAYAYLMSRRDVNLKQKLRLVLLRYAPQLHSKLY